jgi:hypothetical protein
MTSVVRKLAALSLALSALLAAPAFALDTGDIIVESMKGEVRITMNGAESRVRAGGVLELPATIETGRDGAIELRQGATTVSVGPETRLEFPALEKRGGPVDRIVQPRGNAFYDIGKRAGRRLRIETPYLVGVVKGTQFNVASQPDATTISLFEGALEIQASDGSSTIDLRAGEIASRKRGGTAISVIKMEGDKMPAPRAPAAPAGGGGGAAPGVSSPAPATSADSVLVDRGVSAGPAPGGETQAVGTAPEGAGSVTAAVELRGNDSGVNVTSSIETNAVTTGAAVNLGNALAADVDAGASAAAGVINAGVSAGIDAGPADAGVSANVNLGAAASDAGADVAVGAGALTTDVTAAINVNPGAGAIDVGASAGLDAGAIGTDAGAAANVNLGAGAVDLGANVAVDAGPLNVDTGAAAAVDAAGNVATNVDVSVDAGSGNVAGVDTGAAASLDLGSSVDVAANVAVGANVAGVTAGVASGVDVGAGGVDLGVNLGGIELNVGLDLGLDDGNNGNGNDPGHTDNSNPGPGGGTTPSPTAPVVDVVGGLLDGLLNRHRKK